MTQDEIIDMAIQAGASPDENKIWLMYAEEIEAFAKLVAAKEREALAQPEQEPVAWMYQEYRDDDQFGWRDEILFTPPPNDPIYFRNITPLYTQSASDYERGFIDGMQKQMQSSVDKAVNAMSQRPWVGLTDEDISEIVRGTHNTGSFVRAIDAKLKEKNT